MKKELLDDFVKEMISTLKSIKGFSEKQIPQIAKEVLKYNLVNDLFILAVCTSVILASIYLGFLYPYGKYEAPIAQLIGVLVVLFTGMPLVNCVSELIQIITAPRVFLIEYLSSLLSD